MKVTVIGTSCTWFKRKNTSYIIDDDIIFDVPEGAYKDIIKLIDIFKTKCVIISHLHTDHCLNLHVIATRHMRENHGRTERLRIYAPEGALDKMVEMNRIFYGAADVVTKECYNERVEFIDLKDGMTFKEGEYTISVYKMDHGKPESFGFKFTDKNGLSVGFSGDTKVCENLHKMLEKLDYAFVEMSTVKPHATHISTDEFVELSKKYKKTKMFPVHTSDEAQNFAVNKGLNYLNDGQVVEFLSKK